jgi:hypothetical protein
MVLMQRPPRSVALARIRGGLARSDRRASFTQFAARAIVNWLKMALHL